MPIRSLANENFAIKAAALAPNRFDKLPSLAVLLSPQQRRQFLKKLFSGNAAGFDNLLAQLEAAPSWRVAHRVMEQHFYRAQIRPYNSEATRFTDIVYKRYFPQDEYIRC